MNTDLNNILKRSNYSSDNPKLRLTKFSSWTKPLLVDNLKTQYIHVAGTSGKGTVVYTISLILNSHQISTVSFMSPHVYRLNERFLVNSSPITNSQLNLIAKQVLTFEKKHIKNTHLTKFEAFTLMFCLLVKNIQPQFAVIETGLGGRLDPTNVISDKKIAVITRIGFDHTKILGNTISQITTEKAGIIKDGNKVFTLIQTKTAKKTIDKHVSLRSTNLIEVNTSGYDIVKQNLSGTTITTTEGYTFHTSLVGDHQIQNLLLSIAVCKNALKLLNITFKQNVVSETIENLHLPGRFEIIKKNNTTYILDGAHNLQKITALTKTYKAVIHQPAVGIIFIKTGMPTIRILSRFQQICKKVYLLTKSKRTYVLPPNCIPSSNIKQIIKKVKLHKPPYVIVSGSFFILKSAKEAIKSTNLKN